MKALLLKDYYLLRRLIKLYGIMMAVYAVIAIFVKNFGFVSGVNASLFTIMPLTTLNIDASCHWNGFAIASPASRKNIALEKYALAVIIWGIGMAVTLFFGVTFHFIDKEIVGWDEIAGTLVAQTVLLFFDNAVAVPAAFKFGPEKGRYVMMGGLVVPLLLLVAVSDYLDILVSLPWLMAVLVCLPFILFVASMPIAVHICQNMDD